MSAKKKKAPAKQPSVNLNNVSVFNGIKWEGLGIETLHLTAKGLLTIAELFKAQNVTVEAGIKIVSAPTVTAGGET